MSEQKDAGTLIRLAYQGLINLGVDADNILIASGLTKADLDNNKLRTPHWAQSMFWQAAEQVSGDAHIGLHLGKQLPNLKGSVLSYLLFSAADFTDGMQRLLKYQRLISDAIHMDLGSDNGTPYLSYRYPQANWRQLIECTAMYLKRFVDYVSDNQLTITEVHLMHEPTGDISVYEEALGCPVKFMQEENRVYLDEEAMHFTSLHTQPDLMNFHEKLADAQLADLERQDLIADVQTQIARMLESGEVCVESVAKRLNMPPRKLRAQLQEAGSSFSQVLNNYRHQFAKKLLANTSETIAEIVYLTGFSEPSTFYRAFKRWEGITPVEYRKLKQEQDD